MRYLIFIPLIALFFSCNLRLLQDSQRSQSAIENNYKVIDEDSEGKAYVILHNRKAKKGDLSLLCDWKSVDWLKFENVKFEQGYFWEASRCKDIERISLYECNDAGISHFHLFPSLTYISLGGKTCTDSIMQPLSQIKNLKWLLIGSSPITSKGAEYLANAKKIEQLNLEETEVDDTVFQYLLEMPKLREVSLRRTKVTREAAHDFRVAYQQRYGRQIYLYTQQRSDLIE